MMWGLSSLNGGSGAVLTKEQACVVVISAFPTGAFLPLVGTTEERVCNGLVGTLYSKGFRVVNSTDALSSIDALLPFWTGPVEPKIIQNKADLNGILGTLKKNGYTILAPGAPANKLALTRVVPITGDIASGAARAGASVGEFIAAQQNKTPEQIAVQATQPSSPAAKPLPPLTSVQMLNFVTETLGIIDGLKQKQVAEKLLQKQAQGERIYLPPVKKGAIISATGLALIAGALLVVGTVGFVLYRRRK